MVWSQTGISLPCLCAPFQASSLPACPRNQARQLGLIDFDESSGTWRALHGGFDTETDLLAEEDQDELLSFYDWVIRIRSCFDPMHVSA